MYVPVLCQVLNFHWHMSWDCVSNDLTKNTCTDSLQCKKIKDFNKYEWQLLDVSYFLFSFVNNRNMDFYFNIFRDISWLLGTVFYAEQSHQVKIIFGKDICRLQKRLTVKRTFDSLYSIFFFNPLCCKIIYNLSNYTLSNLYLFYKFTWERIQTYYIARQ
jgi:hypothetical protein